MERHADSRDISRDETTSDSQYLRIVRRLEGMLGTSDRFSTSIFTSENPEISEDRKYGVRITTIEGDAEGIIDVYPNLDEDRLLIGFTHTSPFRQIPPEHIMQAFGRLQAQIEREREIIEGIMRVEEGNDRTNWKPVPKPPLGKIRKLD